MWCTWWIGLTWCSGRQGIAPCCGAAWHWALTVSLLHTHTYTQIRMTLVVNGPDAWHAVSPALLHAADRAFAGSTPGCRYCDCTLRLDWMWPLWSVQLFSESLSVSYFGATGNAQTGNLEWGAARSAAAAASASRQGTGATAAAEKKRLWCQSWSEKQRFKSRKGNPSLSELHLLPF